MAGVSMSESRRFYIISGRKWGEFGWLLVLSSWFIVHGLG